MIFWCFVFTYAIAKYLKRKSYIIVLIISIIFAIINPIYILPFGLGKVGIYYAYFLLGYGLKQNLIKLQQKTYLFHVIIAWIFIFIIYTHILTIDFDPNNLIVHVLEIAIMNTCKLLLSLSVIYILYSISNQGRVINWLKEKPRFITLSGYCYGVYIYQQFILKILYYKTTLPLTINEYILPWIGFYITLILSLFFAG